MTLATLFLENKPLLYQLKYLKVGSSKFTIIDKVATKWKDMAYALRFEDHVVENIEHDTQGKGCVEACHLTFRTWLKEEACHVTWERLIEALNDIKLGTMASELAESFIS